MPLTSMRNFRITMILRWLSRNSTGSTKKTPKKQLVTWPTLLLTVHGAAGLTACLPGGNPLLVSEGLLLVAMVCLRAFSGVLVKSLTLSKAAVGLLEAVLVELLEKLLVVLMTLCVGLAVV